MNCLSHFLTRLSLFALLLIFTPMPGQGQTINVDVPDRAPGWPAARIELTLDLSGTPASPSSADSLWRETSSQQPPGDTINPSTGFNLVDDEPVTYSIDTQANQIRLSFTPKSNFNSTQGAANYCKGNRKSQLETVGYGLKLGSLSGVSVTDYAVTTYTASSTDACSCTFDRTSTSPTATATSSVFTSSMGNIRSPIDLTLVVDESGSIGWTAPNSGGLTRKQILDGALQTFINVWESSGNEADRLGVTFFEDDARVPSFSQGFFLRRDRSQNNPWSPIESAINGSSPGGGTSMGDGLLEGFAKMQGFQGGQIVVVTDGMQNEPEEVKTCAALGNPPGCSNVTGSHYAVPSTSEPKPLTARCRVIHPLGVGLNNTTYSTLLDNIANQTGGKAGMTPTSKTPTALINTLVDVLEGSSLDKVLQEEGTVPQGQNSLSPDRFLLNQTADEIIATLNWLGPDNAGALDLRFIGPNGQRRSATKTDRGEFHLVKSVDFGSGGAPGPWEVQVVRRSNSSESVDYQMSVLADEKSFSDEVGFATSHTFTGQTIWLQLALSKGGEPVTGLGPDNFDVQVRRPQTSPGTFLSDRQVPSRVLDTDPDYAEGDPLGSPSIRKIEFLRQNGALDEATAPQQIASPPMREGLPDTEDAFTYGSEGTYTLRFDNTERSGTYEFRIRVEYETKQGGTFSRLVETQRNVMAYPNLSDSEVEVDLGVEGIRVQFTPQDAFGNKLGLGYADALDVTTPVGKGRAYPVDVEGGSDGTYEMIIQEVDRDANSNLVFRLNGRPYHAVTFEQLIGGEIPESRNLPPDDEKGKTGGGCSLFEGGNGSNSASAPGLIFLLVLGAAGRVVHRRLDSVMLTGLE